MVGYLKSIRCVMSKFTTGPFFDILTIKKGTVYEIYGLGEGLLEMFEVIPVPIRFF